jgi:hypothetical protein
VQYAQIDPLDIRTVGSLRGGGGLGGMGIVARIIRALKDYF